jgi:hypothetical protein
MTESVMSSILAHIHNAHEEMAPIDRLTLCAQEYDALVREVASLGGIERATLLSPLSFVFAGVVISRNPYPTGVARIFDIEQAERE